MKLHVPLEKKVLYDFAVSAKKRGTAEVDTVHSMLFQAFCMMHGGENQNVAAYYPLGDICTAFEKCLGPRDYTTMAVELLEEISASARFEIQNVIYDGQDSYYNIAIEASKKAVAYDINRLDDLPYYEPGDTIDPKLHDVLLGTIKQLHEIGKENFLLYINGAPAEERKHFFEQNCQLLIPKTIKDAFFARIMDDAYIVRYLSLYSVDPTTDNQHKVIHALLWNPGLLDHYWKLTECHDEG